MTDLRTLMNKKLMSQMTVNEIQKDITEIRSNRRSFPEKKAAKKKTEFTKKAIDGASVDELKDLLKQLEGM